MLLRKREVSDKDIESALTWYSGQLALARLAREREDVLACCYSAARDVRTGELLHRRTCALILHGAD